MYQSDRAFSAHRVTTCGLRTPPRPAEAMPGHLYKPPHPTADAAAAASAAVDQPNEEHDEL